jgi:chorismate mutase-like protein
LQTPPHRSSPARPARARAFLAAFGLAACASLAAGPAAGRAQGANAPTPVPTPAPVPAPAAAAADRLDEILQRGVLRVGTTGDYKPFSLRAGTSDTWFGLDIALAGDLARALGVRLQLVPTTWPTLMQDFAAGRFDVALGGVSVTLERQKQAFFSIPYLRDGKTPIARCADADRYQTVGQIDRPDVRVIVNPGGTNERFARANVPRASLTVWPDNTTIFDRLAAGDADVMITDAIEARLQQRLHPTLCAVHPDTPFDFSEKAILLPRDVVLKAFVDQWLHQAIESGALARLNEQWLAYPWGLEALRQLIAARLMLASDVAQYKWSHKLPIDDPQREAEIAAGLAQEARRLGVPIAWAQGFFRAQIEASKTVQHELFDGWEAFRRGPFPDAPDLARVTRPRIDRINAALLHALADNYAVLADPARREAVAQALRPVDAGQVSEKAVAQAIAPLVK